MLAIRNNSGFTLIEFVVAVLILMVGLLGLLQTVNTAISSNMVNQLRNEGVVVADQELGRQLAKGFQNASTSAANYLVTRKVLNGFRNYSVTRHNLPAFSNSKQVTLTVKWKYKNTLYSHDASAVISQ